MKCSWYIAHHFHVNNCTEQWRLWCNCTRVSLMSILSPVPSFTEPLVELVPVSSLDYYQFHLPELPKATLIFIVMGAGWKWSHCIPWFTSSPLTSPLFVHITELKPWAHTQITYHKSNILIVRLSTRQNIITLRYFDMTHV